MQKVIIKNFGPIVDVELEVQDFMVFIGPQASGKSTIAKVIYFFKSLRDDLEKIVLNYYKKDSSSLLNVQEFTNRIEELFIKAIKVKFSKIWEKEYAQSLHLEFIYNQENSIEISHNDKLDLVLCFSQRFYSDYCEFMFEILQGYYKKIKNINGISRKEKIDVEFHRNIFIEDVISHNSSWFSEDSTEINYIPASRGAFIGIGQTVYTNSDLITQKFITEIQSEIRTKNTLKSLGEKHLKSKFKKEEFYEKISNSILKGSFYHDEDNEEDFFSIVDKSNNINTFSLTNASSGQQESVWILQYISLKLLTKQKYLTIIEEPEAHLYPEAQKDIISLIALLANSNHNQVIITTHSPYILSAINNLMYAHKVGQKHEKEVSEKIDKNTWLDYKRVGAYFVGGKENEGKIRSILDAELQSIAVEEIDNASRILNEEYDFLTQIDE